MFGCLVGLLLGVFAFVLLWFICGSLLALWRFSAFGVGRGVLVA